MFSLLKEGIFSFSILSFCNHISKTLEFINLCSFFDKPTFMLILYSVLYNPAYYSGLGFIYIYRSFFNFHLLKAVVNTSSFLFYFFSLSVIITTLFSNLNIYFYTLSPLINGLHCLFSRYN